MLFIIVVLMSSILTHHIYRDIIRKRPLHWCYLFLLGVSTTSVYWSDATNLASVSTEIRVLAQLNTGHDRRRVICW